MRIEEVKTRLASLPLPRGPWGDTIHHVTHIEIILVEITADNGVAGTGLSHTSGVGGSAIKALIEHDLTPFVLGKEAAPRALWQPCWQHVHDMGGGGVSTTALGAIDIALWDLLAKSVGLPLTAVLGGKVRDKVQAYASGINLNKPLDVLLGQVEGWLADGYTAFKVKVGKPEIEEDVERLTKVRERIGRLPLMVDANQGWSFAHATRAIRAFEPLAITWVEEPLLCDDIAGYGRLRQIAPCPIAGGENVYTLHQFQQYMAAGGLDFVQADLVRVGGITPYLEIAALARAYNLPMAPHFMMELSGQVLCTLANGHILENIDGGSLTDLKALRPGAAGIVDGWFTPGEKPGHGLEFDLDTFARHAVT